MNTTANSQHKRNVGLIHEMKTKTSLASLLAWMSNLNIKVGSDLLD